MNNSDRDDTQRVVVTGIGVVAPNGRSAEGFYAACCRGESGISPLAFDPVQWGLKTTVAGQVLGFDPATVMEPAEARRVPRMIPMAIDASRQALEMAGLSIAPDDMPAQREIGVALGTGGGGAAFVEEQYRQWFMDGKPSLYSITAGTPGNLSSELSIQLKLRGPSHVLSTGCASSTDAIHYAAMCIRAGVVKRMLAGGADSPIAPGVLTAFEKMRVISTRRWEAEPWRASRPFQADRDGFVLAEGAWMFVLESLESARQRGATVLGEIAGYGSTCDAFHRVQIRPDVIEPVRAIELALADAGMSPGDIGYVNLHGTGTDLNDKLETAALRRVFGDSAGAIPMSATKSLIGHPQGAGGAAGLAATLMAMSAGVVHPTINQEHPDPECDLDYVPNTARPVRFDAALCNCIAFGSKNSAMIVRRV